MLAAPWLGLILFLLLSENPLVQQHCLSGSVPFARQWEHRSWVRRVADDTAKLISPLA